MTNVSFKYDDAQQNALNNINLNISRGEQIALVGKSGAGKSTLAQVIVQRFDAQSGEVTYQNANLKLGFLSQMPYIFNASIRDNITMFQSIDENKISLSLDIFSMSTITPL